MYCPTIFSSKCARSFDLRRMAGLDEDVRLLMTIAGVSYYTALLVKTETSDVIRFRSGEHYCSFIGIVPSTYIAKALQGWCHNP